MTEPTLQERRDIMLFLLNAKYRSVMASGYSHDFGGEYGVQGLQTGAIDQINWLILKDTCTDAMLADMGDQQAAIPLRTLDNVNIPLTYAETASVLRSMRAWGAQVLAHSWALKEAIRDATDENLGQIDITVGWPA